MTYPDPNQPQQPQYPTGAPQWAPPISPPPQYGYSQPPPASRPRNGVGLAAIITSGVAGVLVLVASGGNIFNGATGESLAGAAVGVAAVVLGLVGIVKADKSGASKATAVWGFLIGLVFMVAGFALFGYYAHQASQFQQCLSDLIACGQSQ